MLAQPRVLIVDDELRFVDFLRIFLTNAGYLVEEAMDGHEALELLARGRESHYYGAVLLDMSLPLMSGLAVLQALEASGDGVPVIATSGDRQALQAAQARGACATIAKPFDLDELRALLAQHYRAA
jgi:DNA-binding response OmpR family regulator